MKLLLVRHGETDFNKQGKLQGSRTDQPLNATGIKQVEELAQTLADLNIEAIYSSPLKRTHQTAEIISKATNTPVRIHDGLKERDFGTLSGKYIDDIVSELGETWREADRKGSYDYSPWEGENIDDVRQRWNEFLDFLKQEHSNDDTVLAATSGGIVRLAQLDFNNSMEHIPNASLHEFEI